jgi:GNAT superfamily N-acetyltransferase
MNLSIRPAVMADVPVIRRLIEESSRELSRDDYTPAQIDAALQSALGVDTQLIADGTYFVVESVGTVVACGGWSRRKTLFGSDARKDREPDLLDPARDAAKIRAFFVHPEWARKGIGRALLHRCEDEAKAAGFHSVELMATLPGRRLYAAFGYHARESIQHPLPGGITIEFVPMHKELVSE